MTDLFKNRLQGLPEAGRITDLLDDLLPASAPREEAEAGAKLGSWAVAQFFLRVNWKNEPEAAAPVGEATEPLPVLGSLPVKQFLAIVNWKNQARQATAAGREVPNLQSLDRVLSEFVWD